MMHQNDCKCAHHWIQKLVTVLTVVSALGFWLATLMGGSLFNISSTHYFKEVIVLGILGLGMSLGMCSCCCGGCGTCAVEDKM